MNSSRIRRAAVVGVVLAFAVMLGAYSVALADCSPDGTSGSDDIVCDDDPTPDADGVNGLEGDDTILVTGTVTGGVVDGGPDDDIIINNGSVPFIRGDTVVGDDGGDDVITNNGSVSGSVFGDVVMSGTCGDDVITNNGIVSDSVFGDAGRAISGGDDAITNNGSVGHNIDGRTGDDTIINNGSVGTGLSGGDGDDTLTNNGSVGTSIGGGPDNDTITNNGSVEDFLLGDSGDDAITNNGSVGFDIVGGSGDDTVTLGPGSQVGGTVFGDWGYGNLSGTNDTLIFELEITIGEDQEDQYIQQLLAQGGSGTFAGHTWAEFENLIERLHFHIYGGNTLIDCGKDPYLGQRPFNPYCYPYTGDPNELTGADANTGGMTEE